MTLAQSEPKIVYRICAGCSGDLPPPSPPAEKATARQDQTWKTGTGDGPGTGFTNCISMPISKSFAVRKAIVREDAVCRRLMTVWGLAHLRQRFVR
jgi:hypothetical protein